jgi:hypothetical protein
VLEGDEAGVRRITPTPGVADTSPGPPQRQRVLVPLRNPMTVTFVRP